MTPPPEPGAAGATDARTSSASSTDAPAGPARRRSWRGYVYESEGWLLVAAALIGVLAALANVIFHSAVEGAHDIFWGDLGGTLGIGVQSVRDDVFLDGWDALPGRWWLIPLLPVVGMALLVLLDLVFPGEIHGYGLPRFLEIVNVEGGYIKRRWITLKTLASAITLGSGMSAGVEGPIAQIGGAIGSTVGRVLRPSPERLRVLIAAGTAAAVAATFGSPIAGVMFAEEIILLGHSQLQSLSLLIVAAGTATVASQYLAGYRQVIDTPVFDFTINHELFFYLLLGLCCAPVAVFFIRTFHAIKEWVAGSPIARVARPIVGAMIVGTCLIVFPQVAGSGYEVINETLRGGLSWPLLFSLVLMKMLMTGVTLGFGGSGGVFAPSMFIGAVFGSGFAQVVNTLWPETIADPGTFALVGMGAMLAAATHAPMTAIFLLFELTRDYNVVVPIMITGITATIMARRLEPESIDEYELARRGLHLHAEARARMLHQLAVRSLVARDVQVVRDDASVEALVRIVTVSRHSLVPVVDSGDRLVGVVGMDDLRAVLLESESWAERSVGELLRRDVPTIREGDSVFDALEVLAARGVDEAVVVDDDRPLSVVGILKRSELQSFSQKTLLARDLLG